MESEPGTYLYLDTPHTPCRQGPGLLKQEVPPIVIIKSNGGPSLFPKPEEEYLPLLVILNHAHRVEPILQEGCWNYRRLFSRAHRQRYSTWVSGFLFILFSFGSFIILFFSSPSSFASFVFLLPQPGRPPPLFFVFLGNQLHRRRPFKVNSRKVSFASHKPTAY